jgi:hypothetical protein
VGIAYPSIRDAAPVFPLCCTTRTMTSHTPHRASSQLIRKGCCINVCSCTFRHLQIPQNTVFHSLPPTLEIISDNPKLMQHVIIIVHYSYITSYAQHSGSRHYKYLSHPYHKSITHPPHPMSYPLPSQSQSQ